MSKILIDEATVKLALEALENSIDLVSQEARNAEELYGKYPTRLARIQGLVAFEVAHEKAITAVRKALAEQPAQQEPVAGCVCRWNSEGDRVVTCERHQGWLEVISEWAERARDAEKKLKALTQQAGYPEQPAQPDQEPVAYWIPKAEQFCIADPSGRPFAKAWEPLYTTPQPAQQEPVAWVGCGECDCSFSCNKGATACIRNANETSTFAVSERTEYEARIKRLGEMLTLQYESGERLAARLMELEALAEQPAQQEPVAWLVVSQYSGGKRLDVEWNIDADAMAFVHGRLPLYTSPLAQRKPLMDAEIDELSRTMVKGNKSVNWLCRAIEAAHGIKENT